MSRAVAVVAIALLAWPATVHGEVRLEDSPPGGLTLSVRPAPRGTWTPLAGRAGVLNPTGDIVGDGYPGFASTGDDLVVTWVCPSSDVIAIVERSRWKGFRATSVPASGAVGTPIVARSRDEWLIAWQQVMPSVGVEVAGYDSRSGPSDPVAVEDGLLSAVVPLGSTFFVLAQDPVAGQLTVGTVVFLTPHIPVPIDTFAVVLRPPVTAGPGTARPATAPVQLCTATSGGAGAHQALVAWSAAPGVVGRIRLDERGLVGDVDFMRGPDATCDQVLATARRR